MTKRQDRDPIYVKRQFDTQIIVLCVRWYISYRLNYRDLVAMMAERGVSVSHTTIMRWVIRYVPEFEKRWNDTASLACEGANHIFGRTRASIRAARLFELQAPVPLFQQSPTLVAPERWSTVHISGTSSHDPSNSSRVLGF